MKEIKIKGYIGTAVKIKEIVKFVEMGMTKWGSSNY